MPVNRIRIRCEKEDRSRWKKICADYAVDEGQVTTLRSLMDVYEEVPNALRAADEGYIDPDDRIIIYPSPRTARRFRYWCRNFETQADALRELLDLAENTPEGIPTLDV